MKDMVVIYTTKTCPYCIRAKQLLNHKGIPFKEIDITDDQEREQEMTRLTGRKTVPQILIHGAPVGGCDELHDLDRCGELDRLLHTK